MTLTRLHRLRRSWLPLLAVAAITATAVAACGSSKKTTTATLKAHPTTFASHVFASGVPITIKTPAGTTSIYQPDDMTQLGGHIFVGFQNGVGPQGEPTPKGSAGAGGVDSTVVDFSSSGTPGAHWNISGHIDGLTADPATGQVIATTNEDANAHLFTLKPGSSQAVNYGLPALPHNGGLDAISFWHGMMLISASAPGTSGKAPPQAAYPAVYVVSLNSGTHKATVRELFGDEASATKTNSGASGTTKLALTDPDSNAVVPSYATKFAGDFELTSQGDDEQIYASDTSGKQLSVLKLSQAVDDSAWLSGPSSTLYVSDNSADLIYKITGPFKAGSEYTAVTPCDASNAPASCPSPTFPNNYLGQIDPSTGSISKFTVPGATIQPKGLLVVP